MLGVRKYILCLFSIFSSFFYAYVSPVLHILFFCIYSNNNLSMSYYYPIIITRSRSRYYAYWSSRTVCIRIPTLMLLLLFKHSVLMLFTIHKYSNNTYSIVDRCLLRECIRGLYGVTESNKINDVHMMANKLSYKDTTPQ